MRKNPFNYALNTVIEDDRKPRIALTEEQEEKLLSFVESDRYAHASLDGVKAEMVSLIA